MFGFFKKTAEAIRSVAPQKEATVSKEMLEEILLEADVAYETVEEIIYYLPPSDKVKREPLRKILLSYFIEAPAEEETTDKPFVELIFGVNGAGKTTTIGKLAFRYKTEGKSVMLGAADTFRAAAIEQLKKWAERIDVPIVATRQGHDPSAVAFDTITSAKAKGLDHILIDTAGRLHTQSNLAKELQKIVRICDKAKSGAPDRKTLVLDGTQGNSAIAQAHAFHEMIGIDALIVTKLDGTAKGGAIFSIAKEIQKPILYLGVGEGKANLIPFDKEQFVDALLDEIFTEA
ncbi:MAG: signal recognition particle-docking protein FtsY [Sulfurospirillum sp.]|nr:MAG: signal recognition particle-docking protein FtsY [Sulfurospirillum sp.]